MLVGLLVLISVYHLNLVNQTAFVGWVYKLTDHQVFCSSHTDCPWYCLPEATRRHHCFYSGSHLIETFICVVTDLIFLFHSALPKGLLSLWCFCSCKCFIKQYTLTLQISLSEKEVTESLISLGNWVILNFLKFCLGVYPWVCFKRPSRYFWGHWFSQIK